MLQRFPSLKRITITPTTHRWLFCPLYETPTIRILPYSFNYPIPHSWPTILDGYPPCEISHCYTNVAPDPDVRATERGSGGSVEHHVPLAGLVPAGS